MKWIALGAGGLYPASVRALKGKRGVYAIRSPGGFLTSPEVLYVGESHKGGAGGLYDTLTRHFQHWRRSRQRSWWFSIERYRPRQSDPGHTYDRGAVEISWQVATSEPAALRLQSEWIARLRPRDNLAGVVLEDAPF